MTITRKDIEVIFHAQQSVLCNNREPWVKKRVVVLMLLWECMMGWECANLLAFLFYI